MDKLMGDFLVIDIEGQAKDSAEQFARMLVDAKRLIERMRELAVENAALKLKIYPEDTGPKTGLKDEHN